MTVWDYLSPDNIFWLRGWFPWEEIHIRAATDEELKLLNAFFRASFMADSQ